MSSLSGDGDRRKAGSAFYNCSNFRSITFGTSLKLARICAEAFCGTRLESLAIPDSVVELCEKCFDNCNTIRSVTFGTLSGLERICRGAFQRTSIESFVVPGSTVELCERCLSNCKHLQCVTFGTSSKTELIGALCFARSMIGSFEIPASVVKLGGGVFSECPINSESFDCECCGFIVRDRLLLSQATHVCHGLVCTVREVVIPETVVELGEACFCLCTTLQCVKFEESSHLERICGYALL